MKFGVFFNVKFEPRLAKTSFFEVFQKRYIFSLSGVLDTELTNDVKKSIEDHWKRKVNEPHPLSKNAEKFYLLSMFPYPSGSLHMGHMRVYTISDSIARFQRMNGKKVIHPIGWDAFGLPAENAAIERNVHPSTWTENNISTMKKQLQDLNISFDWDMELATCDPSYYKWTQYIFLLMYQQGLAYKKQALVNWDPVDQTVLADEQVDENGCSWRSGVKVEKRNLSQWFLRTSMFSKDLYEGLNDPNLVNWRDVSKIQENWIGEPEGYIFHLNIKHGSRLLEDTIPIWTKTPELLYGATFVALSPDSYFNVPDYNGGLDTDQKLNIVAVHPFTNEILPVYVTRSLESSPVTDSCLGIPISENESHLEFAIKNKINVTEVLNKENNYLINSEELTGMDRSTAKNAVVEKAKTSRIKFYQASGKLRDWLISRQRYWGAPIPIINCPSCKSVPVPEKDLPVLLPKVAEFGGKSFSLKNCQDWIHVKCPKCGGAAKRETDTMDTFVDSSWYFLRYLNVNNQSQPFDPITTNASVPVDLYIGGKEHASLHLFYARFVCHFLHSIKFLDCPEPFQQLLMQGMIMGKSYRVKNSGKYITKEEVDLSDSKLTEKSSGDAVVEEWEKMSKSKFNGVDPHKVIEEHGIDTARMFILGSVSPQSPRKWNDDLFPGIKNFQWRLWLTVADFLEHKNLSTLKELSSDKVLAHETRLEDARNYYIKGITHHYANTRLLNVVVAKLQGLLGELRRIPKSMAQSPSFEKSLAHLLIMLAPVAPHFSSELWTAFSSVASKHMHNYDLSLPALHQNWPAFDDDAKMLINIKLNGDECDSIPISRKNLLCLQAEKAIEMAVASERVIDLLGGARILHARYKTWPNYDSEVIIVYKPLGKSSKKKRKLPVSVSAA